MKKKFILTTIISLFLLAVAVSAQTTKPNFAGDWELDVSKSVLPETMRIESMTMKVAQTDKELKIETMAKRSANDTRGGGMGGGGMRRGGGDGMQTYSLEGKEMNADIAGGGMMTGKEIRKASLTSDGKLSLTLTRNINGEMGSVTIKTNDNWELLDEGKTLKVIRYTETPRGATTAELFFTKKSEGIKTTMGTVETPATNGGEVSSREISGGVLNGKAITLMKPEYPAAARAVRASGAVNVKVTIDEQGDIISASAVSGHPLLRAAAEEAARNSKFAPTSLEGVPVKVTGIIVYNFVP